MINTEAIVVKSVKFNETSLILTLLTKELGLRSFIVKGVRKVKSTRPVAMFQPGVVLWVAFNDVPNSNLLFLKSVTFVSDYLLDNNIIKQSIRTYCVELIGQLLQEEVPQEDAFVLYLEILTYLIKGERLALIPLYFTTNIARVSGYAINGVYDTDTPFLSIHEGSFTCQSGQVAKLTHEELLVVSAVANQFYDLEKLVRLELTHAQRSFTLDLYLSFLELHATGFKPLKSLAVIKTVLM